MFTRKTHTVTYESAVERFRDEVTTYRLFGIIPIYHKRTELWRRAGIVDDSMRAIVFAVDDWQCVYCGATDEKLMTIDHRIPQIHGGTSAFENLLTACKSCNSAKHDKTPEEARLSLLYGRFQELPEVADEFLQLISWGDDLIRCDIGGYSFYSLRFAYYRGIGRRVLQRHGAIRRAVINEKPHDVIRRRGWDALDHINLAASENQLAEWRADPAYWVLENLSAAEGRKQYLEDLSTANEVQS